MTVGRYIASEVGWSIASPVTNRIADGLEAYGRAAAHCADTREGFAGLSSMGGRRGARGAGTIHVGGEWWHGGSDRKNALAQLGIDFQTFQNDLVSAGKASPEIAAWVASDVAPAFAEWQNFVANLASSTIASYVTEWSVFEAWWQRLDRLRDLAKAHGIHLTSAALIPLPRTVWERGQSGTGSPLDVWLSLAKVAILGVVGVTGIVGVYAMLREFHGKLAE